MLRLDDALALIDRRFQPVTAVETVGIGQAAGRILAAPVTASVPLPQADNAAMDGYALRAAGTAAGGARLAIVGRAAAGRPFAGTVGPGQAVRIFTGGVLPAGADAVVKQELAERPDEGHVVLAAAVAPGTNVRHRGEMLQAGATALAAGQALDPLRLGLAADLGAVTLQVRAPLRVALVSSGDELVPVGQAPLPHQVIDSNRPMLTAALTRAGCRISQYPVLPDERARMAATLAQAAAAHDLVVTTAGMSVGEEDHVRAVLETRGEMIFRRPAIKPGRPVGLGLLDGTPVLGLPGNPGAAAVALLLVGRHLLQVLAGAMPAPLPRFTVSAGFAAAKPQGERLYVPGRLSGTVVERLAPSAAANLAWAAQTQGLVELPEDVAAVEPGAPVAFIPLDGGWP